MKRKIFVGIFTTVTVLFSSGAVFAAGSNDFYMMQDGTNLAVNLPVEFVGATITLQSRSNLVDGVWADLLQTNAISSGWLELGSVILPDLPYSAGSTTNVFSGEIPDPGTATNSTGTVSSNRNTVAMFYRVSASSTNDTDGDLLGDLYEHLLGTDFQDTDSDNDALEDGEEVFTYGLDPGSSDTDGDGVPDAIDANMQGTTGEDGVLIVLPDGEYRHMPESQLNFNSYGAYGN